MRHLFGTTYRVRPIIAAQAYKQAEEALGAEHARALRVVTLPPVTDRRDDVPTLLDGLITREMGQRSIHDIGATNLAAVVANHKWRGNWRDLREVARRCRALLDAPTQAEAAALLDVSPSTLSEWLRGLGMKWPPVDAPRARTTI